jgi:membrane-associated PAP2 superfamily phosphatase
MAVNDDGNTETEIRIQLKILTAMSIQATAIMLMGLSIILLLAMLINRGYENKTLRTVSYVLLGLVLGTTINLLIKVL